MSTVPEDPKASLVEVIKIAFRRSIIARVLSEEERAAIDIPECPSYYQGRSEAFIEVALNLRICTLEEVHELCREAAAEVQSMPGFEDSIIEVNFDGEGSVTTLTTIPAPDSTTVH